MTARRLLSSVREYSKTVRRAAIVTEMSIDEIRRGPRPTKQLCTSHIRNNIEMPTKLLSNAAVKQQESPTLEKLVFDPKGLVNNNNDTATDDKDVNAEFEAAIKQLNILQSNDVTIRNSMDNPRVNTKADTLKYLERSGLPLTKLEQLSFIHVAGTKGKGSTCALTESLLRHNGVHTGFFSSPHIVYTTERIRIDGLPLAKEKFTKQFWKVYKRLQERQEFELDMPAYFKFLTILAFHVFIEERVDVAVLEVGIGGEHDCTNIVRNVRTVGIASLGLEHTELLGNTLPEIAWQKAGIIKPGAHVYTHVSQPECLQVIRQRAQENQAILHEVPPTRHYFQSNQYAQHWDNLNQVVKLNGSLAIHLATDWLSQTSGPLHRDYTLNEAKLEPEILLGLLNAHWPGRCQLVEYRGMRLHLDGAHTMESMAVCTKWFAESISQSSSPRILIFNRTGGSDIRQMLSLVNRACAYDMVCFVPNYATSNPNAPSQVMVRFSPEQRMMRVRDIATQWSQMCTQEKQPDRGQVYSTLTDAFTSIRQRFDTDNGHIEVLITGSIHLLGAAISALNYMDQSQT
ncbi:folylpolyglutamate synthase, mitochondrial [Drosophila pseudoobscura]|uniref:Folylpolyglutamate synthase n=1 Tax=Drosophila pseudoobscura pseudoobscura TaxID=46245 RepID=Q29J67_DROPS|nr:folylpolyglutamate synthase, mitochondrial [Drosophila pseudoobscura]